MDPFYNVLHCIVLYCIDCVVCIVHYSVTRSVYLTHSIPGFLEKGQLLVFKLNILQTDSFSGYKQNFKQRKHFQKANPRY